MKKAVCVCLVLVVMLFATSCASRQSAQVSYNLSKEADQFNVVRRISVINARTDKPMLEVTGNISLANNSTNELEIVIQTGPNEYKKHFVYLNDWVLYVVEDISGANVSPYHYEINYLPEMIIPIEFTSSY